MRQTPSHAPEASKQADNILRPTALNLNAIPSRKSPKAGPLTGRLLGRRGKVLGLILMSWNARSLSRKQAAFLRMLEEKDVDVAVVQEAQC